MRKIIVTGFSGFVARHYLEYLYENERDVELLGLDIAEPKFSLDDYRDRIGIDFKTVNLLDEEQVKTIIGEFSPTEILHLAAFSSVSYSWEHPSECFNNNTRVFLSVVEAVRTLGLKTRILSVGSSEIYGDVDESMLPLKEDMEIHPLSAYAIARQSQESLAAIYTDHFGVDIIATRSFNHIGPRQDERFVIPSFIRRILEVKKTGASSGEIETGDTTIIRDFLDVRDVVRAYDMLLKSGVCGRTYNIASGRGVSLNEIIDEIAGICGVSITGRVNPKFVRPTDNRCIIGDASLIKKDVGWEPEIPLRQTISDMIELMQQNA